ncbi:MAG TPA: hypothetical protein VN176_20005 [Verrucomicrobiae bacterium]|jgi:hypothetical protein|nr:hypothetical protein [Verrucomicrobiae bacterium]
MGRSAAPAERHEKSNRSDLLSCFFPRRRAKGIYLGALLLRLRAGLRQQGREIFSSFTQPLASPPGEAPGGLAQTGLTYAAPMALRKQAISSQHSARAGTKAKTQTLPPTKAAVSIQQSAISQARTKARKADSSLRSE